MFGKGVPYSFENGNCRRVGRRRRTRNVWEIVKTEVNPVAESPVPASRWIIIKRSPSKNFPSGPPLVENGASDFQFGLCTCRDIYWQTDICTKQGVFRQMIRSSVLEIFIMIYIYKYVYTMVTLLANTSNDITFRTQKQTNGLVITNY